MCISKLNYHWFRSGANSLSELIQLNWLKGSIDKKSAYWQCWLIVNWILSNKFRCNSTFIQIRIHVQQFFSYKQHTKKYRFQNVWKMVAISSRPQCVNQFYRSVRFQGFIFPAMMFLHQWTKPYLIVFQIQDEAPAAPMVPVSEVSQFSSSYIFQFVSYNSRITDEISRELFY